MDYDTKLTYPKFLFLYEIYENRSFSNISLWKAKRNFANPSFDCLSNDNATILNIDIICRILSILIGGSRTKVS